MYPVIARNFPANPRAFNPRAPRKARVVRTAPTTARQGDYIRSLAARLGESVTVPPLQGDASALIDNLKARIDAAPAPAAAPAAPKPEPVGEGIYSTGPGEIFRVKVSRQSGRPYATRLVTGGFGDPATFEYAPGMVYRLTEEHRLTREVAGALGIRFGVCVCCGKELTVEESIERGMGPVCYGKKFWV